MFYYVSELFVECLCYLSRCNCCFVIEYYCADLCLGMPCIYLVFDMHVGFICDDIVCLDVPSGCHFSVI